MEKIMEELMKCPKDIQASILGLIEQIAKKNYWNSIARTNELNERLCKLFDKELKKKGESHV